MRADKTKRTVEQSTRARGQIGEGAPMAHADYAEAFRSPVREVCQAHSSGRDRKAAIARTARFFGISERRVRACLHGEVKAIMVEEWMQVQQRWATWLEEDLRRTEAAIELKRARWDAMQKGRE